MDEKSCCQFWGFEVSSTEEELTLRWDGPPSSEELLDLFLAYFRGEQPIERDHRPALAARRVGFAV